jgi:N-acetylglucosamine-6-phosphate deacetylase
LASHTIVGRAVEDGAVWELEVGEGGLRGTTKADAREADPTLWIGPGLCDIQVNGYAGHDLNGAHPGPEVVSGLREALLASGVTTFCPTVVTDNVEAMAARLRAIATALRTDPAVASSIPCIHLEGPFISPEDGPRGAHPAAHVAPASWETFCELQAAADGRIGLVTLAAEVPGARPLISRLVAEGVIVAIGHTAADRATIVEAAGLGAALSTHLGNGAHALLPRHDNYVWAQLADDRLHASFILDGHHLPPDVAKCMIRAKGSYRSILVSDSTHLAGLAPGRYEFAGQAVELSEAGRISLVGTPYLAGSALRLADAIPNAARFAGVSLAEAWRMASDVPRALLGVGQAGWAPDACGTSGLLAMRVAPGEAPRIACVAAPIGT